MLRLPASLSLPLPVLLPDNGTLTRPLSLPACCQLLGCQAGPFKDVRIAEHLSAVLYNVVKHNVHYTYIATLEKTVITFYGTE